MAEETTKTIPPPAPLASGTVVLYAIEDSGMDYVDKGVFLQPGVEYVVGDGEGADLPGDFAALLEHRGIVTVKPVAKVTLPTPTPALAPAPPPASPAAAPSLPASSDTQQAS